MLWDTCCNLTTFCSYGGIVRKSSVISIYIFWHIIDISAACGTYGTDSTKSIALKLLKALVKGA